MVGLIFNEFLSFVDSRWPGRGRILLGIVGRSSAMGYDPLEAYDYDELLTLVRIVARGDGIAPDDTLRQFGMRLFEQLTVLCPAFRGRGEDALTFLEGIEHMRGEVDFDGAEMQCLRCRKLSAGVLQIDYASVRNLAGLVEGLIRGCILHFGGGVQVERTDLPGAPGRAARFVLTAATSESARRAV